MARLDRLAQAGLWCLIGLCASPGLAQSAPANSRAGSPAPLAVPYLPQSVLLCGGAAVAMVERWWGRRGVYAEDFANLVRPDLGGIRTTDLASAARSRGWDTRILQGTAEVVQAMLRERVPVIALLRVGRDRYHFVVVLQWEDDRVIFHDPAGSPFTALEGRDFLERWSGAHRWAMALQPVVPPAAPDVPPSPPAPAPSLPCAPYVDRALDAALAGDLDAATRWLALARTACPSEPVVLRELAGVRFKQGRHADVVALSREYLELAPDDAHAWQLLAASRYLLGDRDGALLAWNQVHRPTIDLLRIDGTRAIRFRALARALDVPHGAFLTPSRLALLRRRASDVPAVRRAAVGYQPVPGGLVEVVATVAERPLTGPAWRLAAGGAVRAVAQREAELLIGSPTGAGELVTLRWRWQVARPGTLVRLDVPMALGMPGVLGVAGAWERYRFAPAPGTTEVLTEARRASTVDFGAWVSPSLHLSVGGAWERWSEDRRYLALSVGTEYRTRDDRLTVSGTALRGVALADHAPYLRGNFGVRYASSLGLDRAMWSARVGADWVTAAAPPGAWPVAGGHLTWTLPLRAHPIGVSASVPAAQTGRQVTHGGLSADLPVYRVGPVILAAGAFVDAADIRRPLDRSREQRWTLDGGVGLRLSLPGQRMRTVRLDYATTLRGTAGSAVTVGMHQSWPP